MRNIKYILFVLISLFFNIVYVDASCTSEEIESLKELVKDIKITYKHKGKVINDEGEEYYNLFDVTVKDIDNDMYVTLDDGSTIFNPVDGQITKTFNNGTWNFDIYSKKCESKIDTINVFLPRFNMYYLDPLCEGIDGDEFALCGKYYEYDVDYDNFVSRVKHYRATYKVDNRNDQDDDYEVNKFNLTINKFLNFIIKYRLYITISFVLVLVILIAIIIIKKIRKRGVLE